MPFRRCSMTITRKYIWMSTFGLPVAIDDWYEILIFVVIMNLVLQRNVFHRYQVPRRRNNHRTYGKWNAIPSALTRTCTNNFRNERSSSVIIITPRFYSIRHVQLISVLEMALVPKLAHCASKHCTDQQTRISIHSSNQPIQFAAGTLQLTLHGPIPYGYCQRVLERRLIPSVLFSSTSVPPGNSHDRIELNVWGIYVLNL